MIMKEDESTVEIQIGARNEDENGEIGTRLGHLEISREGINRSRGDEQKVNSQKTFGHHFIRKMVIHVIQYRVA